MQSKEACCCCCKVASVMSGIVNKTLRKNLRINRKLQKSQLDTPLKISLHSSIVPYLAASLNFLDSWRPGGLILKANGTILNIFKLCVKFPKSYFLKSLLFLNLRLLLSCCLMLICMWKCDHSPFSENIHAH